MLKLYKNIRENRLALGMSQEELAHKTGYTSRSSIAKIEKGEVDLPQTKILLFAKALGTTPAVLMGWETDPRPTVDPSIFRYDNIEPMPNMVPKPLLGTIACGEPILAQENIEDMISVPDTVHCDFVLRCRGDSMKDAKINNGDIVYVRQQPTVENGEIAAVLIGEEATLKRVYHREPDRLELHPANPDYPVMVYIGSELENIKILGKAVGCLFAIR